MKGTIVIATMTDKKTTVQEAVSMLRDGMTLMIGGFLGNGSPENIIDEIVRVGLKDLTIIANDTSYTDKGLGKLVANHQVKKLIVTHIGTNPVTGEKYNNKDIEIEFVPQGTLAERIRCGGSGLGGVLTRTGVGTIIAEGKQSMTIDGIEYLLELPLRADAALVYATKGDEYGNLVYMGTMQNFNPLMAMAADLVIAEIEHIVPAGEISVESIHTPHIMVDKIVQHN